MLILTGSCSWLLFSCRGQELELNHIPMKRPRINRGIFIGAELQNLLKLFDALMNGQLLDVPTITARNLPEDKVIY